MQCRRCCENVFFSYIINSDTNHTGMDKNESRSSYDLSESDVVNDEQQKLQEDSIFDKIEWPLSVLGLFYQFALKLEKR